jgi:hypothetical protein
MTPASPEQPHATSNLTPGNAISLGIGRARPWGQAPRLAADAGPHGV